jgi:hypothetical protein
VSEHGDGYSRALVIHERLISELIARNEVQEDGWVKAGRRGVAELLT